MRRTQAAPVIVAAFLLALCAARPGGAAELGRPTVYADAWGGVYRGTPSALLTEQGWALGTAVGAYFDLGQRTGGALRATYWETSDDRTFSRRYTGVDALLGPRLGDWRLLLGLSVLDRRDFSGEQGGGWGWRIGVAGERVLRRVVAGGGVYLTPTMLLRRWSGGSELAPARAAALEGEFYLVIPLGGAWAVRGGYRGFHLLIEDADDAGGGRREVGQGLFLGATARF
ncbi:MAG: hypothetical protein QME79_04510 [Bacillota bacterium]|nr:hypothetical protein [Bacillota bacterium]